VTGKGEGVVVKVQEEGRGGNRPTSETRNGVERESFIPGGGGVLMERKALIFGGACASRRIAHEGEVLT